MSNGQWVNTNCLEKNMNQYHQNFDELGKRFELKLLIVTAQIYLLSSSTNLVYIIEVNKLLQTDEINSSDSLLLLLVIN